MVQQRKRKKKRTSHINTDRSMTSSPRKSMHVRWSNERMRLNQPDVHSVYVCMWCSSSFCCFFLVRTHEARTAIWPTSGATWTEFEQRSLIINRPFWMISFGFTLAVYLFPLQDCKSYRTEEEKDRSIKSRLHLELYNRISILISCSQPLCAPL